MEINMSKAKDKQISEMYMIYGDSNLGIRGEDFHFIFSYGGGPECLVFQGKEWLYRSPKPTFWRAVTDNDRGNGFPMRSGMWLAADVFLPCCGVKTCIDGNKELPKAPANNSFTGRETAKEVCITYTYNTITIPSTKVEVSYKIVPDGSIQVTAHYYGKKKLPQLPLFGMRFIMPTKAVGFEYEGLSGETYPDRMYGGIPGVYQVEGLPVTKHLIPQDCGVHMETEWVNIYRDHTRSNVGKPIGEYGKEKDTMENKFGIRISATEKKFAFSCLPYTAEELENATHQEELPLPRRTVLSVLGAVRGVGGIDSWGANVDKSCEIDGEKDIEFSFKISGIRN